MFFGGPLPTLTQGGSESGKEESDGDMIDALPKTLLGDAHPVDSPDNVFTLNQGVIGLLILAAEQVSMPAGVGADATQQFFHPGCP